MRIWTKSVKDTLHAVGTISHPHPLSMTCGGLRVIWTTLLRSLRSTTRSSTEGFTAPALGYLERNRDLYICPLPMNVKMIKSRVCIQLKGQRLFFLALTLFSSSWHRVPVPRSTASTLQELLSRRNARRPGKTKRERTKGRRWNGISPLKIIMKILGACENQFRNRVRIFFSPFIVMSAGAKLEYRIRYSGVIKKDHRQALMVLPLMSERERKSICFCSSSRVSPG